MNRCGFGPCGGAMRFAGGGGTGWLAVLDSIALWILAIAAVLFLLGLRRRSRSWGRGGARGTATYQGGSRGAVPGGWTGWAGPGGPGGPGGPVGPGVPKFPGAAPGVPPHQVQAEATLADRFSRGEITAEQYRSGIDTLRGLSPYPSYPSYPSQPQSQPQPEPPPGPVAPGHPEPTAGSADLID